MLNVVIPEPITSLNKGEAAILEGIHAALLLYGDHSLTVFSPPPWIDDDRRNYAGVYKVVDGVDLFDVANSYLDVSIPRNRMHFFKTWGKLFLFSLLSRISIKLATVLIRDNLFESMARSDLILAGHNGFLGYRHSWLVLAARIMGTPVALFGGGNDAKGRSSFKIRKYYQFAINNSILCTVRDSGSRDYLITNGISPEKVHLFPDPAVLLKPCSDERVNEIMKIECIPNSAVKPLYGLIPVRGGIVFEKSFSAENTLEKKHQARVNLWVDIISHLIDTTDAHFIFIPHCIGPTSKNDDRHMNKDTYASIPYAKDRITLIENEYSPAELKGLIKNCSFVLGERTHGLIGATSVATPLIALTVKEDSRMHNIINKMFNQNTFNLNSPDITTLKKLLTTEWNNRAKTALRMTKEASRIHQEAYSAANLLKESISKTLKGN